VPDVSGRPRGNATFTIVTTEASAAMRPLHDWMPMILPAGDCGAWLNGATAVEKVQALVRPCPEATLVVYAVGRAVGVTCATRGELIQPHA
jgi:putative SOS response-associated peptidase YedK